MNGFLLECLYPTGWRRTGEIYWRFCDANGTCERLIRDRLIRAARILPVTIHADAVAMFEATADTEVAEHA